MGAYNYKALDANGKTVKGVIEGDSDKQVRAILRQRQLRPLDVQGYSAAGVPIGTNAKTKRFGFSSAPKLGYKDIALVTRHWHRLYSLAYRWMRCCRRRLHKSKNLPLKALCCRCGPASWRGSL